MKKNNIIKFVKDYGLLLGITVGPIILIILLYVFKEPVTKAKVHWHMPISYNLCGDTTQLKDDGEHGSLHGHNDKKVHVEGIIDTENRAETLGGFFDTTSIIFSETQIGKYKNGDKCEGSDKPGKVSLFVNGIENFDFRKYILNDKDEIKILFK